MKIDQPAHSAGTGPAHASESASAAAASSLKRGDSNGLPGGDTVNLSGPLRVLQNSASSRASRIASLTQSVRGGVYSVSAAAISGALIQETLAGRSSTRTS